MKQKGTITISGKRVKFRESKRPLKRVYGYALREGEIVISCGLEPRKRLEIAIHEMLHLEHWGLSEEFVKEAAIELAEGLEEMGVIILPEE